MERNAREDLDRSLGPSADTSSAPVGTDAAGSTAPATAGARNPKDAVQHALGTIRERATTLQATLADRLDAGAERIRQRARTAPESVANGMHETADWLRNGDLRADLAREVREHPGRSLLIALGLGLIIGRSMRSK
jgi:ElaB/YqjD/DUF883 family membrane-anchored ribosome-binding protein